MTLIQLREADLDHTEDQSTCATSKPCRSPSRTLTPDAVVTDAAVWDVATHRAGLDTELGMPIFKSLTDVVTYLGL